MSEWTKGPKARVTVKLINPESGYESETEASVSAEDWNVIDRVLCGRGQVYAAAPTMAEALEEAERTFRHYGDLHAAKPDPVKAQRNYEMADKMLAALRLAKGEDRNG